MTLYGTKCVGCHEMKYPILLSKPCNFIELECDVSTCHQPWPLVSEPGTRHEPRTHVMVSSVG